MPFEDSKIVLTGGAGGIGALVARELRGLGADVLVVDRLEPPEGERYLQGDLSTMSGISAVAYALRHQAPHMLINLAGAQYFGPAEDQPGAQVHTGYMVNLLAPVLLTQAVLPVMKQRASGQIVNIGSIFGSINYPHFATYSSAKAGLRGFSEALRRELHGSGIDVTYIAPRAVRTGLNNSLVMRFAELAKMHMDEPEAVARRIVRAIRERRTDVFIGARERFFVRVNALLPRLVDSVLSSQTIKARKLFTP